MTPTSVGARIVRVRELVEATPEQAKALEEHLADEAGLVAEELVDRRRRRVRLAGDSPGGESSDSLVRQHTHGHAQDVVAQLGRSLLRARHG